MAKRRKSTRRRSTRRHRSLGMVPVYPPTLLAVGMPAPALTVGPMLGSPPEDHARRGNAAGYTMLQQLKDGRDFAMQDRCDLALNKLVAASRNSGMYIAERQGITSLNVQSEQNDAMNKVGLLRDMVIRCYSRSNK